MSRHKTDPESRHFIHQRYQDTAVVVFKEQHRALRQALSPSSPTPKAAWQGDALADDGGASSSSTTFSYSRYGNQAVIVHQDGTLVAKRDMGAVQSAVCVVM
ncbi:uncharacterized protein LOC119720724 isoform X2 [Patiria miniata]|uniref:Uncharacterized protein n=1 Tax=Patiria miniata TaxID=46514 RepID=A0A913Z6M6_PATMI|nr:uncharacterized protein LOC119720724 isoform X2 [Patiria miniata]